MSNEELVARIQSGEKELIGDLWNQVERLVAWKAGRIINRLDGMGSIEFDDLYQSGFLALMAAIPSYNPEGGAFSGWLMFYLQTAFAEAYGYRSEREKRDPIHSHRSIDAPLQDKDGNEAALGDLIEDPSAREAMNSIDEQLFQEELRCTLDRLLSGLSEGCGEVLKRRYYENKTLQVVADQSGIDLQRVRNLELKGLRELRKPARAKHLRPFIEFDYHRGTGLHAFRHTGISVQERYMIKQERVEEQAKHNLDSVT